MISDDGHVFAPPGSRRLCVMREERAVVREWKIPKPVVLVERMLMGPEEMKIIVAMFKPIG